MVYARRRRVGRRAGRRGARTLTTRNIFNRKGARAQAAQISALKKRINRVYRRTKPEFKVLRSATENRAFGYATTNGPSFLDRYALLGINLPSEGTADSQRIGNKLSLYPVNFFMNVRYTETNEIISNVYPYIQHPLKTTGMMLRFVAVQAIAAEAAPPTPSDIFQGAYLDDSDSTPDSMMMMTMPFKNGITTKYKILKDKRIRVNQDNPIYAARFKVKPVIKSLRWEAGVSQPAGMIYYIIIGAGGDVTAQSVEGTTYFNYNYLDTTWRHEITYTDA